MVCANLIIFVPVILSLLIGILLYGKLLLLPHLFIYLIVYLHKYGLMVISVILCVIIPYYHYVFCCMIPIWPHCLSSTWLCHNSSPDLSGPKVSSISWNTNLPLCFQELV